MQHCLAFTLSRFTSNGFAMAPLLPSSVTGVHPPESEGSRFQGVDFPRISFSGPVIPVNQSQAIAGREPLVVFNVLNRLCTWTMRRRLFILGQRLPYVEVGLWFDSAFPRLKRDGKK